MASEYEFRFHRWQEADPAFDSRKAEERKLQLEARLRPLVRHARWLQFARQAVPSDPTFRNVSLHVTGEG